MNATVDLTRARVIEADLRNDGKRIRILASREYQHEQQFNVHTEDDMPVERWRLHVKDFAGVAALCENIRVLAEFPLTLADLLPAGCEAFRFSGKSTTITDIAIFDANFQTWEVTGHDGDFTSLADLQRELNVDLDSVVPLELRTHPDYVEAQR